MAKEGMEEVVTEPVYCPYDITPEELNLINENRDTAKLLSYNGVQGLAKALHSNLHDGLVESSTSSTGTVQVHREVYGENKFPETAAKSFFRLVYENLQDPVIIILCLAATVNTVLGLAIEEERKKNGWIEGVAIWVAVTLVVSVSAGNDYQKDRQFRKLNAQRDRIMVKVIRDGHNKLVENTELVVGDVLLLDTGDKVVADGLVVMGQGLVIDEAALTGESDPIKKYPIEAGHEDGWVRSGTQVSEGSGKLIVIAVGPLSEWGKTMALVGEAGDDETPLQQKLTVVASTVGKIGFGVAVACFVALVIKWCVSNKGFPIKKINDHGPVQFFLFAVTIIVVAVPEGLPLAVTISLAYSMKKMMKDNNFVRVLAACETMGGATAICSDKTGTLTENRMTVVEGWFAGVSFDRLPRQNELPASVFEDLKLNAALNSKAFLLDNEGRLELVGNRTECALLIMLRAWGISYEELREKNETTLVRLFGFSSVKKMASCLIRMPGSYRLFNKGAAEWVLKRAVRVTDEQGQVNELTDSARVLLLEKITEMARRGLRCICLAVRDFPLQDPDRPDDFFENSDNLDNELTVLAIVGIKDPVRPEVPAAVRTCKGAGIVIRMVTGDNIFTAQHIARECGILEDDEMHVCLEGPAFRALHADALLPILPRLRVLARSSPEDKLTLVRLLKQQGDVVAVTGDGTNDAPALKESDVGLAMGIAGTEVAKEAADIVILDDNFSSIVKSVLWGRSVFTNIRKFLMFQLTVNLVALVISFFGAVIGGHEPLNVLQLLWVNLIMDTMGALALATEDPTPELLLMRPYGRTESLITRVMWKHIFVQGGYQLFWMFFILYAVPNFIPYYEIKSKRDYYKDECIELLNKSPKFAVNSTLLCGIINHCGFPYGDRYDMTFDCPLHTAGDPPLPSAEQAAVCGLTYTGVCPLLSMLREARELIKDKHSDFDSEEYRRPLSLLFNCFIFCQLFNEINARRINDEYTIFQGLFSNAIFLGVLIITVIFQVCIINIPGLNTSFFKVQRLAWQEWLASIAVGAGSMPLSMLTRVMTKNMDGVLCLRQTRVHAARSMSGNVKASPRSLSGSSSVGRVKMGSRAGSIRVSPKSPV